MAEEPTPKMLEVYEFILSHVAEHGYQPTTTEIAQELGVATNAVWQRLKGLERFGLVELSDQPRALRLPKVRFKVIRRG